jgi:hypothetical protein
MSKYLALLELPPLLKRLKAMVKRDAGEDEGSE